VLQRGVLTSSLKFSQIKVKISVIFPSLGKGSWTLLAQDFWLGLFTNVCGSLIFCEPLSIKLIMHLRIYHFSQQSAHSFISTSAF